MTISFSDRKGGGPAGQVESHVAAQARRREMCWWGYVTASWVTGLALLGMAAAFLGNEAGIGGMLCLMMAFGCVVALIFGVLWACAPEPGQKDLTPGRGRDDQNS